MTQEKLKALIENQASPEEFSLQPFPSRRPMVETQINIRGRVDVITNFKRACRIERRTYSDMLERMMKAYGEPKE